MDALAQPVHDEFMDPDMRALWNTMSALPGALRLYGGTALALYLNHRQSVDFDFFTTEPDVRRSALAGLRWLAGAELRGRVGSIEATWAGERRNVRLTFLEARAIVPPPQDAPRFAPNGVAVASPRDLVRAKLEAICNRGAARDYRDIAAAFDAWPALAATAFESLPDRTAEDIAIAVANPPLAEIGGIDDATAAAIRHHAAYRRRNT